MQSLPTSGLDSGCDRGTGKDTLKLRNQSVDTLQTISDFLGCVHKHIAGQIRHFLRMLFQDQNVNTKEFKKKQKEKKEEHENELKGAGKKWTWISLITSARSNQTKRKR